MDDDEKKNDVSLAAVYFTPDKLITAVIELLLNSIRENMNNFSVSSDTLSCFISFFVLNEFKFLKKA